MWPEGWDDSIEMQTSGAQLKRPTKATAPPPSVILGTFANRNTHDKSGSGSNVRGLKSSTQQSQYKTVCVGKGLVSGHERKHTLCSISPELRMKVEATKHNRQRRDCFDCFNICSGKQRMSYEQWGTQAERSSKSKILVFCLSSQTLNHKRVQKLSGFVHHRQVAIKRDKAPKINHSSPHPSSHAKSDNAMKRRSERCP